MGWRGNNIEWCFNGLKKHYQLRSILDLIDKQLIKPNNIDLHNGIIFISCLFNQYIPHTFYKRHSSFLHFVPVFVMLRHTMIFHAINEIAITDFYNLFTVCGCLSLFSLTFKWDSIQWNSGWSSSHEIYCAIPLWIPAFNCSNCHFWNNVTIWIQFNSSQLFRMEWFVTICHNVSNYPKSSSNLISVNKLRCYRWFSWRIQVRQGPLLLTWFNFNPSMDK